MDYFQRSNMPFSSSVSKFSLHPICPAFLRYVLRIPKDVHMMGHCAISRRCFCTAGSEWVWKRGRFVLQLRISSHECPIRKFTHFLVFRVTEVELNHFAPARGKIYTSISPVEEFLPGTWQASMPHRHRSATQTNKTATKGKRDPVTSLIRHHFHYATRKCIAFIQLFSKIPKTRKQLKNAPRPHTGFWTEMILGVWKCVHRFSMKRTAPTAGQMGCSPASSCIVWQYSAIRL